MATIAKNAVGQYASFTGASIVTLSGAALEGGRTFSVYADGTAGIPAMMQEMDSDGARGLPVAWEWRGCTYDAIAGTLTRNGTIYASSNGGAAVSFGAGIKRVFVALPADDVVTPADLTAGLEGKANASHTQAASTISGLATVATTGAYSALTGLPTLGTASALNVAASGNAASGQVVKGDDTRLGAGGGMTAGSVLFAGASGLAQDNANFFYDDTLNRVGIGTALPRGNIDIPGYSTTAPQLIGGEFCLQTVGANNSFIFGNAYFDGGIRALASGSAAGFQFDGATIRLYSFGIGAAGAVISVTQTAFASSAGLTVTEKVTAKIIASTSYTLAALNSAYPSPVVGDRSFITDETTGAFRGACVGGGAISTPVYYDGVWRNG